MSVSNTIVLRDLATGAGRTGLTVKLRKSPFAADFATGAEIAGKPGVYEFVDVPFDLYKLWVNGSEEKSWGGNNGKNWPDIKGYVDANFVDKTTPQSIVSGVKTFWELPHFWNPTDGVPLLPTLPEQAVCKKFVNDNFIDKTTDQIISDGVKTFYKLPHFWNTALDGPLLPTLPEESICKKYADDSFIRVTDTGNYMWVGQQCIMVEGISNETTVNKHKLNIQAAIDYAQGAGAGLSNEWNIIIIVKKSHVHCVENITLQPYIHISTIGGLIKHKGTISGININTKLENIFSSYIGNRTFDGLNARNCIFRSTRWGISPGAGYELKVQNSVIENVGFISTGGTANTARVTTGGNNIFFGACWANKLEAADVTDKGILYDYADNAIDREFEDESGS